MITDFKAVLAELTNVLPGQVVAAVLQKPQALSDNKCRTETVFLEQRGHMGNVRFVPIIECQNHQLVGDRQQFASLVSMAGVHKKQEADDNP